MPILSIIIPTNRTGEIALSNLLQYFPFASEDVEVLISDNS